MSLLAYTSQNLQKTLYSLNTFHKEIFLKTTLINSMSNLCIRFSLYLQNVTVSIDYWDCI